MTVTPRIKLDAPLEDIQRSMNVITTAVSRLSNKAEHIVDTEAACLALGVSRRTLIRWTKTRGLTPRGKDTRGRNLYNLADLWAAQAARTPPRAPE